MTIHQEVDILLKRIYALEHNYKGIRTELRLLQADIQRLTEVLKSSKDGL